MKSIVYEHKAAAQADCARLTFKRAGTAIETVEWALSRDPDVGLPLVPGGDILLAVFDGAKSIKMPTIEVLYRDRPHSVEIVDMEFSG